MMVTGWRYGPSEQQQQQDYTPVNLVHRSSPQAAWVEPGTQAQALLTHFMLKSTALSPKAGMIDYNSHSDVPETAPGGTAAQQKGAYVRGYRSQPSSPARTRRPASDHAQQYGLLNGVSGHGQLAVSAAAGSSSSPRGQSGTWSRSSGRPSSNPSPSRGPGHLSGSAQVMGRTQQDSKRTAGVGSSRTGSTSASQHKFGYGYEQQQQQQQPAQQLGDFFTAMSLKVPQRYDQSPYLKSSSSSSRTAQPSTGSGGLQSPRGMQSPRSPKGKALGNTTSTAGKTSGSYSRPAQLGALYSSNPDPVGRLKMGAAGTTSRQVSSSQEGFTPSRGPGALVASSSSASSSRSSTPTSGVGATSGAAQFRSSVGTARRTGTPSSPNTSASRAAMPQASAAGLAAHKQSLHAQQQLWQSQAQQQQQPDRQMTAGQQQQQLSAASSFQQQPSQPYINTSGQLSAMMVSTSSSTVAGRPQTANGSSRADLRAGDSSIAAAGPSGSGAAAQAGGVNLDTQSWSTFLTLSTCTTTAPAGSEGAAPSHAARSSTPLSASGSRSSAGQQQQQQQRPQPQPVPRSLQTQMLADLGQTGVNVSPDSAAASAASVRLSSSGGAFMQQQGSSSGTPTAQRQPSSSLMGAVQQQLQQQPAAATSRPPSTPGGAKASILQQSTTSAAAAAAVAGGVDPSVQQQATIRSHRESNSAAAATAGADRPASPAGAAAAGSQVVPGPLHAGLMRPRSANNLLQPAVQAVQQQQVAASSPQSAYLQTLQQQNQQQHSSSGTSSPVPTRMPGQPVTPLSAIRRRSSAAEMMSAALASGGANSPVGCTGSVPGAAGSSDGAAAGSPTPAYHQQQQQQWASIRTEDVQSPWTTILTAQQQQVLQSASPVPLRRMGSATSTDGASSPVLSRLQGEWGTLTAMSALRTSGFGASLAESSAELSCSSPACNSTASWSSMGGTGPPAHLISSLAAAAGAGSPAGPLTTGGSVTGPGPSPLGIGSRPGSTTGTPQHAAGAYGGHSGGIGSFGNPVVGARRALNFSHGDGSTAAAPASRTDGARTASRQDAAAAAADDTVVAGQASSTTSSYTGSRSSSFSSQQAAAAAAAAATVGAPAAAAQQTAAQQTAAQQQHQSMEQRLNQLQQMHQAYKQQLQEAARLLDAAAGSSGTAATQQRPQQATVAGAAAGSIDAARPTATAAYAGSRRESSSAAEHKEQAAARTAAATGSWSIASAQQQQQQQQQQVERPPSRPHNVQQPEQQQQQQKQRRESASNVAAAPQQAAASRTASNTLAPAAAAAAAAAAAPVSATAQAAQAASKATTAQATTAQATPAADANSAAAAASRPPASPAPPAAAGTSSSSSSAAAVTAAAADAGSEPLLLPGYSVGAVVGEGGFCQVRLAVHHLSRRRVAVKVIDKTKLSDAAEARRMQREIRVLKRLNHPCVIRLFEVLEAGQKLLLVMEYAPGGSLLDYVRGRKRLGEAEAAYFLQQILTGLQYCHDNEVVHRDIKLENILLDSNRAMKLIDFGLAAFYAPGKKLRVHCGSPSYAAPEIVARKQYEGPPVDVWSLGVVLFAMLAGFLPFHSPTGNKQELCQKIMAGTFNTPDWLSPGARDLLGRMLTVDPEARISLADAAQHPWTRSSGLTWELPSYHCYSLPNQHHGAGCSSIRSSGSSSDAMGYQQREPSNGGSQEAGEGQLAAQASILEELEGHGYSRNAVMKYLAAGESNYITASYYLLAEARHEASQKLMPQKPWPFQPVAVSSRSSGSSRSRTASSSAARPASGAAAPSSATRPSSGPAAATAAGGGYTSTRPATAVAVTS